MIGFSDFFGSGFTKTSIEYCINIAPVEDRYCTIPGTCDNDIRFSFRPNFFRSESERNYSDSHVTLLSCISNALNYLNVHILVNFIFYTKKPMSSKHLKC